MSASDTIFNRIAWLCSRREYCSRGVLDLLRRKGVTGRDADEILGKLRAGRYVDDGRYARAFARDKALLSGWGPRKIACALSSKGIPPEMVKKALEEVGEEESTARMREVIANKWRSLRNQEPQERRMRVLRFAMSRGFDYGAVTEVLDSLEE